MTEYYPMLMFPKIMVTNIEKSTKWYELALGFKSIYKFRNSKNEVILNHLRLNKYQDIMLIQSDNVKIGNSIYLNLMVNDVKAMLKSVSPKAIQSPIEQKPWNATEAVVKDPDGHLITLTHPNISKEDLNPKTFKKSMRKTRSKLNYKSNR
ncbi:glyoxalase [Philodulcilactobacillus myokoensis]|uniref:Glyoxalase n=1 Tax=Philodulcilactobacillus myokoensis TaxID=2929573 RepID=A0A9W6AZZ7_9LACO|nr:VOC family protein [Philodulcilactobacillus myokoensis]GLB46173.1 glyoxalase [Philodulcilactobacillus myokoensis]